MHAKLWNDLFVLGVPVAEKVLRPVFVYAFLGIGLRLAGKREMAALNPFDLIVLLTLSNTVQNAIIGEDSTITGAVIGATTLLLVNYAVVRFLYGHERLDRLCEGAPDVLVKGGKVQLARLKAELVTLPELETAAHKQGFASLADIESAVLEPGGSLTFIGKKPAPDTVRHQELVQRLDRLTRAVAELAQARRS